MVRLDEQRAQRAAKTAGVLSVIADAIITNVVTSVCVDAARKRELQGLLRMLYVEIEDNRGTAELLLSEQPNAEYWTETVYKDEVWKEVRVRLAQLLPDADHFNHLNAYYARNANHQKPILDVIKMGSSFNNPDNVLAATMAEMLEQQVELGTTALKIIRQYIPDTPVARETVEDAWKEAERINAARLQREPDAEKEHREQEEQ